MVVCSHDDILHFSKFGGLFRFPDRIEVELFTYLYIFCCLLVCVFYINVPHRSILYPSIDVEHLYRIQPNKRKALRQIYFHRYVNKKPSKIDIQHPIWTKRNSLFLRWFPVMYYLLLWIVNCFTGNTLNTKHHSMWQGFMYSIF